MTRQFLDDEGFDAINWSSCFPGLNLRERTSETLCRQVAPQIVQELTDAPIQVWEETHKYTICCLIRSMPSCCLEYMQARGGHADY